MPPARVTKAQDDRNRRAHWDFVSKLPCVCCFDRFYLWLMAQPDEAMVNLMMMVQELSETGSAVQLSRTEVAHMGRDASRRGLAQRYPWGEVWPLCGGHHREFTNSHHAGTSTFWEKHPELNRDGIIDLLVRARAANPIDVTI